MGYRGFFSLHNIPSFWTSVGVLTSEEFRKRNLLTTSDRCPKGRNIMETKEAAIRIKRCISKILAENKGSLQKLRIEETNRRRGFILQTQQKRRTDRSDVDAC